MRQPDGVTATLPGEQSPARCLALARAGGYDAVVTIARKETSLLRVDVGSRHVLGEMEVTVVRTAQVLGLTVAMCWISGLIALRKLRAADPADVF